MIYRNMKLGLFLGLMLFTVPSLFAAEYEWTDASGAVKSLADYKGKPVVLHFWASWCPPCRSEMPELQAWSRAHADVALVVITLDRNIADASAFLESKNISFPALKGDMGSAQRLGVRGLPTTIVFGPDSDIRKTRIGAVDWKSEEDGGAILKAYNSDS